MYLARLRMVLAASVASSADIALQIVSGESGKLVGMRARAQLEMKNERRVHLGVVIALGPVALTVNGVSGATALVTMSCAVQVLKKKRCVALVVRCANAHATINVNGTLGVSARPQGATQVMLKSGLVALVRLRAGLAQRHANGEIGERVALRRVAPATQSLALVVIVASRSGRVRRVVDGVSGATVTVKESARQALRRASIVG